MLAAITETNPNMSKTFDGHSVTVTVDELVRAIDMMGLTPTVSAGKLYHAILQLQATPYTPRPRATPAQRKMLLQRKSNSRCLFTVI